MCWGIPGLPLGPLNRHHGGEKIQSQVAQVSCWYSEVTCPL